MLIYISGNKKRMLYHTFTGHQKTGSLEYWAMSFEDQKPIVVITDDTARTIYKIHGKTKKSCMIIAVILLKRLPLNTNNSIKVLGFSVDATGYQTVTLQV